MVIHKPQFNRNQDTLRKSYFSFNRSFVCRVAGHLHSYPIKDHTWNNANKGRKPYPAG